MEGAGTATVLVTDLVGSTALRVAVGESAADRLRQSHDHLLSRVVARWGGSVVKGTGDGIIATFPGASDAVAAAVEVQQAVHGWDAGTGSPQSVRVGISAGDVSWDDGDCFGTPVIEAARLCATADGGQILVADVVRVLARGRHGNALTPLGALELKGLPEAVTTYEVSWTPAEGRSGDQVALPTALHTDREFSFAGRTEELRLLEEQWSASQAGARRCTLLAGEPGIGKTRLAAEIAQIAHAAGATVLYGRCDEDMGFSYQPFAEALQYFVQQRGTGLRPEELGPFPGDLTRLCPDLAGVIAAPPPLQSDPEVERRRLFDAVAGWLRAAGSDRPVLVVVDDLHGAPKPALLMLRHIVRETEGAAVFIVATYRDTELGRTHPLADTLAQLRRVDGVERVSLTGLDERDLARLLDQAVPDPLTEVVYAETEGNPFFAREVLRHLQESNAISKRDGRWVVERPIAQLGIPEGVREVVGRRLARLSPAANDALSLASIMGTTTRLDVLALVHGGNEDDLVAALDEAVAARLLMEVGIGSYRFSHALVRATLYDELGLTARVRLHHRVGEAIESLHPGDVRALTHHFGVAAAGGADRGRAARYNVLAAREAQDALAADEARRLAETALELLDGVEDDVLRGDALTCLGQAERILGDGKHREHLLEAARLARARGDVERLVVATLANGGGVGDQAGTDHERIELLEAALDAIAADDSADRARLLALLAGELGSFAGAASAKAFSKADEALAVARRVGDPHTLTFVLHELFLATQVPHTRERRLELTTENLALATELGDPVALGWALQDDGFVKAEYGDLAIMADAFDRAAQIGEQAGIVALYRPAYHVRAATAISEGRLKDAERLADEAFQIFTETGHRSAALFYAGQLIAIRRDQGRLAEILPLVTQAAADNPAISALRAVLSMIHADLDQPSGARSSLRALAPDGFAAIHYDWLWLTAMCSCAEVSAWLRDRATAEVLLEQLTPFSDHFAMLVAPVGAVAHFVGALAGVLERYDDADAYFAEAVAMEVRSGSLACLARTRVDWARMLLARGSAEDAARATEVLDAALDTASSVGLPTVERRARELLAGA